MLGVTASASDRQAPRRGSADAPGARRLGGRRRRKRSRSLFFCCCFRSSSSSAAALLRRVGRGRHPGGRGALPRRPGCPRRSLEHQRGGHRGRQAASAQEQRRRRRLLLFCLFSLSSSRSSAPPPEGHPRLRVPGLGRRLGGHPGAGGAPRGINHQPSRRRQRRRAVSRLCPSRRRRGRARIARGDRDRALGVSRGVPGARVRVRRRARGPEGGKREREGRRQQQQRRRRRRSSRCRRRRLLAAGAPLGGGAGRVPLRGALRPPASAASAAACRDRVDAGRQAPRDRPLDHGLGPCLGRGEAFVAAAVVAFVADAVGVVSLLSARRRRCQLRSRQQLAEALPRSEGFFRRC